MTIASSTNKHIYQGNGATTQWPFTFKIFDESNIQIFLTDPTGAETKLDTGYRVDKQNGYVEYPYPSGTPLPSGWKITLLRVVPLVQETDLVNQGPFFAEVIEDALDRLTAIDQQQQEKLDRTIILPVSAGADVSTELPTPAPLKSFRWDATGKKLEVTDDPKVSADAAAASAGQAAAFATAAANSANAAAESATAAQNSASQAAASATAAANSAAQAQALAETLQISDTPQPGKILKLDENAKLPASITGDAATVGGKAPGTGANNVLVLDGSGKVPTANLPSIPSANLPIASASALGAIKVGANLSIDANGVLSAINYDAAHSFATSGYQKLSNGLIIQWGSAWVNANAQINVTLPIAFPNACLHALASYGTNFNFADEQGTCGASPVSTTQIALRNASQDGLTIYYIVIGY